MTKELNNYIVITGKNHCYRWLYALNDNLANLIFVEPNDTERINNLLDSVDVSAILIHLPSQNANTETISDNTVSPGISAVFSHLQTQEASSIIVPSDADSAKLSADLAMIEDILHAKPLLTIIGLVEVINQGTLLPIMRAGVRDLIKIGAPAHEASAIIARYSKRAPVLEQAEKADLGHITALLNARAEDGTALLAIHLALEMQRSAPTLLIDLGAPHADIMLMLGVTAKISFVDAIKNRTRLDSTLIQTGFAKHQSGLTLLSSLEPDGEDTSITSTEAYLVLHTLKRHFKHIVINHGGLSNPELLKVVLSLAESTIFLVEQTVPSCKRNYDLLQSLREQKTNIPSPKIIIDRHLHDAIPSAENIAKSFDMPLLSKLSSASQLRLLTINTGVSLFEHAPKSAYVRDVKRIVQKLIDRKFDDKRPESRPSNSNWILSKLYSLLKMSEN